eukprot:jgi/Botrbrau1/11461/Bobra.27_4s0002.1
MLRYAALKLRNLQTQKLSAHVLQNILYEQEVSFMRVNHLYFSGTPVVAANSRHYQISVTASQRQILSTSQSARLSKHDRSAIPSTALVVPEISQGAGRSGGGLGPSLLQLSDVMIKDTSQGRLETAHMSINTVGLESAFGVVFATAPTRTIPALEALVETPDTPAQLDLHSGAASQPRISRRKHQEPLPANVSVTEMPAGLVPALGQAGKETTAVFAAGIAEETIPKKTAKRRNRASELAAPLEEAAGVAAAFPPDVKVGVDVRKGLPVVGIDGVEPAVGLGLSQGTGKDAGRRRQKTSDSSTNPRVGDSNWGEQSHPPGVPPNGGTEEMISAGRKIPAVNKQRRRKVPASATPEGGERVEGALREVALDPGGDLSLVKVSKKSRKTKSALGTDPSSEVPRDPCTEGASAEMAATLPVPPKGRGGAKQKNSVMAMASQHPVCPEVALAAGVSGGTAVPQEPATPAKAPRSRKRAVAVAQGLEKPLAAGAVVMPEGPDVGGPVVSTPQRRKRKGTKNGESAAEVGTGTAGEQAVFVEAVVEEEKKAKRRRKAKEVAAGDGPTAAEEGGSLVRVVEEEKKVKRKRKPNEVAVAAEDAVEDAAQGAVKQPRKRIVRATYEIPTWDILESARQAIPGPRPVPNLGYACLNMTLREMKPAVFTNRDCIQATYLSKGLAYISQLALENSRALPAIIKWNNEQGIRFFRLSSGIFPWCTEYDLEQLPDHEGIASNLAFAGQLARAYDQRLTFHPSHFIKLGTDDEALVSKSIKELEVHSQVFDLMGYEPSHWNKINIHVGGVYGNKQATLDKFAANFRRLSPGLRARLTLENDDTPSGYSISDLLPLHQATKIPLVFDFHHYKFCRGEHTTCKEAFLAALKTWPAGVRPVVHWSESQEGRKAHAHSDYVSGPINLFGLEAEVDVMIEAKCKELALLRYRDTSSAEPSKADQMAMKLL